MMSVKEDDENVVENDDVPQKNISFPTFSSRDRKKEWDEGCGEWYNFFVCFSIRSACLCR